MMLSLHLANRKQLREICELVNLAYRGEEGWTRETDILQGDRATLAEIESALDNTDSHLLTYVDNDEVLACICITRDNEHAYLGLLSVHPRLQGKGIGKLVLALAETYATQELGITKYRMAVVSQRHELITYYERRGYRRTGIIEDYPVHLNVGIPKVSGLTIEYLEKNACSVF